MTRSVTTPTKPSPSKAAPSPTKSSPAKAIPSPPRRAHIIQPTREAKYAPKITVYAFHPPFSFEIYLYETNPAKDAFLNPFRRHFNEEENYPILTDNDFIDLLSRRIPFSANEHWMSPDKKYNRYVILRYPKGGQTTTETRKKGLETLKTFVGDASVFNYPQKNPTLLDATNEQNYEPLDAFLMDEDIMKRLQHEFDDKVLNSTFCAEYPQFSTKCWSAEHIPDCAKALGFKMN